MKNLNQALKNQFQTQKEYQKLVEEKKRKNNIYEQLRTEKLETNKEIQNLKKIAK